MNASAPDAFLTAQELELFCDFLRRRTGMVFNESKRYYIDRRVADRMRASGDDSFNAFFARLNRDAAELEKTVNAFTINETYFNRESHQLACMTRDLLPRLVRGREPGAKIRILSLPCATGEEPYSIALWLLERWPLVDAFNVEIVGADIDTAALALARHGWYGARALSKLAEPELQTYFDPPQGERRRLIQDLRESVTFAPANLIDPWSVRALGRFDLVFCRNVLIYFDAAGRRTAAGALHDSLNPGGYLLLGHTETMLAIDERFALQRFDDALVYRRPEAK